MQREKAAPLWEDPRLMTAEALNDIFAPDEKVNPLFGSRTHGF